MPGCQEEDSVPRTDALTTGWLLSSCLGLHHCPALMGLMFPVENLVPREGWFSDHWSRVDGTLSFLVQISLQLWEAAPFSLAPATLRKRRLHGPYSVPPAVSHGSSQLVGQQQKPHHHRAEMLPGCGWAIRGGDCLPRKRRVYGEETWRGQIFLPASQGE